MKLGKVLSRLSKPLNDVDEYRSMKFFIKLLCINLVSRGAPVKKGNFTRVGGRGFENRKALLMIMTRRKIIIIKNVINKN